MTRIEPSAGVEAPPPVPAGRLRAAWRTAHAPAAGVPRWARIAAYAVPFVVLPSSFWRLPATFLHGGGLGVKVYLVCLSIVAELVAFTAVGLVASWGERFPRWIPWLRGRRVPTLAAVIPDGCRRLPDRDVDDRVRRRLSGSDAGRRTGSR